MDRDGFGQDAKVVANAFGDYFHVTARLGGRPPNFLAHGGKLGAHIQLVCFLSIESIQSPVDSIEPPVDSIEPPVHRSLEL
jgi:hypothetical protein